MASSELQLTVEQVWQDFLHQYMCIVGPCTAGSILEHPIEYLNNKLKDPRQKKNFARQVAQILVQINPGFGGRCTDTIDKERAMDLMLGFPGTTHVLAMSTDVISRTTMPVFWRGPPAPSKIRDWLNKSLVQTLDTTVKKFKLCVAADLCGVTLSGKVFFAGYGSGNSPPPYHYTPDPGLSTFWHRCGGVGVALFVVRPGPVWPSRPSSGQRPTSQWHLLL